MYGCCLLTAVLIAAVLPRSDIFCTKNPVGNAVMQAYPTTATPLPPYPLPWRKRKYGDRLPRMLLWNRTGVGRWWTAGDAVCPIGSNRWVVCEVTEDQYELSSSDAVVFVADNLKYLNIPTLRTSFQPWVFWAKHPRPPQGARATRSDLLLRRFASDMFTWTMAYTDDADIVVPYKTWRCGSATDKPLAETIERPRDNLTSEKRKDAAWVVGSCEQYRFENQILSLGTVDDPAGCRSVNAETSTEGTVSIRLFPDCGANKCSSRSECIQHIAENYHFIVVSLKPECFQSAYELIYDAFEYSIIPVVLAPPNSNLNVPDHSVVSSADFREPGELAARLRDLLNDRAMYESYFDWKQNCSLTQPENELCPLCRLLWETPADHFNVHPGVNEWWERRLICQRESLHGLDSAFVSER